MIAFCFLLYDKVEHQTIWENFFSQDQSNRHVIFSHLKSVTENTPDWIEQAKVPSVNTDWCGEGLVHAFNQMLKPALLNRKIKYFCLLSGACIPLYSFRDTYKKIFSDHRARISYQKEENNVFEHRKDIYNAHQWVILNRKVARDYIRLSNPGDNKAKKFITHFRDLYDQNGIDVGDFKAEKLVENPTWVGGCPDEVYPINWLAYLYKKKLKTYVKNQMSTYTSWDFEKDPDHPEIFNIKTVKKAKKEICGKGHIFARKFTPEAGQYIAMTCGLTAPPIVSKELIGRLGNQMFQYASMLGIAYRKRGKVCILQETFDDENRNPQEDMVNVFRGPFEKCRTKIKPNRKVSEKHYGKYNIEPFLQYKNIEIRTDFDQGFLQSWKYFQPIKDQIKAKFTFRKDILSSAKKYLKKIRGDSRTKVIGIHIRRGDYIKLGYLKFPPLDYFSRAKKFFQDKYVTEDNVKLKFIIVTNDKNWAKNNFPDDTIAEGKSSPEDMAVLSLCDGVILTVGTFGFWAGYLCDGTVVYYNKEFVMSHPVNKGHVSKEDYYPSDWIGLD